MGMLRAALRLADAFSARSGLMPGPIQADALIAAARRASGLHAFPAGPSARDDGSSEEAVRAALGVLLRALDDEAALSLFGALAVRWDMRRFLINLLTLEAAERADPTIARTVIDRPIFILGLPRSGTTFLHPLLACDPGLMAPRVWQTVYPYPPPRGPDRRRARVDAQLRQFSRIAPELQSVHPIDADTPQECSEITATVFRSLRFDTTFRVPAYLGWLDAQGHLEAYRFHRRFLQHLQRRAADHGAPRRWVLKCPDHVFALDAIRAVYPDARMVVVHRDPMHVLASVLHLTEVLRAPFTRRIDRAEIGATVTARWATGAEHILWAGPGAAAHVEHADLVADPRRVLRTLHERLALPPRPDAAAAVGALLAARPDGGYSRHAYDMRLYGVEPAQAAGRFAGYAECRPSHPTKCARTAVA